MKFTVIRIDTDGDFSIPLADNITHFGHAYVIVCPHGEQDIILANLSTIADPVYLGPLIDWYFTNPDDYVEFGNHSLSIDTIDAASPQQIIDACDLVGCLYRT